MDEEPTIRVAVKNRTTITITTLWALQPICKNQSKCPHPLFQIQVFFRVTRIKLQIKNTPWVKECFLSTQGKISINFVLSRGITRVISTVTRT